MIHALAYYPNEIIYNILINKNIISKLDHSSTRYFVVGLSAFVADYTVLLLSYYLLDLPLKLATSLGFFSGFLISFSVNRQWVFGGKQRKHLSRQIVEYLILVVFNYLFTVWSVFFLNSHGIKPFIGKVLVMVLVMCWNYALFRWVIFASRAEEPESV